MMALIESPPGADTEIKSPQLLYPASVPVLVLAAMGMTPLQFAGKYPDTFLLLLPAAAITTDPREIAWVMADWRYPGHAPCPARDKLMILAGFRFAGTPLITPPAAQTIASVTSVA